MDLYHSWIYVYVLNAKWFVWSTVVIVLAFNFLAPMIIWMVMTRRGFSIKLIKKKP
ncbi:hypothetical protein [Niallia oryzisoli]|uniref:hypothetical protein n=1 Tax=Niallia oryzisoli TaxID=1737571 RepID=UPI0037364CE7